MFDTILNILRNAHFEAYIGGPICGVIAAAIFAGLGNRPTDARGRHVSPRQAELRIERYSYHITARGTQNDGGSLFVGMALVLLVAAFLFAAFLPQLTFVLNSFIATVGFFAMTALLLACLTGQFNTIQWWALAVIPFMVSIACLGVAIQANEAINPEVVVFAQNLLGQQPVSLSLVLNGTVTFFKAIRNEYVQWIMFDMLAFICVALCGVVAFLQCIHYVALSNTRVSDAEGWRTFAIRTRRFGSLSSTFFALMLLAAAWFLASGGMYRLIHA